MFLLPLSWRRSFSWNYTAFCEIRCVFTFFFVINVHFLKKSNDLHNKRFRQNSIKIEDINYEGLTDLGSFFFNFLNLYHSEKKIFVNTAYCYTI